MMPLAMIGVLILAGLVGWGVWMLSTKVKIEQSTPRYRYEKTKDEDGNEITKVVDLEDDAK